MQIRRQKFRFRLKLQEDENIIVQKKCTIDILDLKKVAHARVAKGFHEREDYKRGMEKQMFEALLCFMTEESVWMPVAV